MIFQITSSSYTVSFAFVSSMKMVLALLWAALDSQNRSLPNS
ncbi:hypothetical protein HMPREF1510_1961 [Streptococcus sp. ACC21]|nr:hypothetical protein HMPREF1510_1961 [Streptococcus sp. ACC21]EWC98514.1 hypothetical protein HMPREF1509_0030 [Streptococcus sp. AC15]